MRFWKHSLLAAAVFMGITSVVTYTSCTNDSCKTLICRNGGTCSDEACTCPDGYEGQQCEVVSRHKFYGFYDGNTKINSSPVIIDSAVVFSNAGDTTNRIILTTIYSRQPEILSGSVTKNDVFFDIPGKTITYKMVAENRIEIVIDEMVDGKRVITNFQGTKRQ